MGLVRLKLVASAALCAGLLVSATPRLAALESPQGSAAIFAAPQRDGSHDFDFLIGNWKAHVRRLPDRLNGSNVWNEYDGISNHKKLLDSNANFEEFEVSSADKKLHIKAQTLRLYNPETHQWSIYGVDLDKGTLDVPPVVGQFYGDRGEFYNQQPHKGRVILVRYIWLNNSPKSARMEQSFFAGWRTDLGSELGVRALAIASACPRRPPWAFVRTLLRTRSWRCGDSLL